MTTVFEVFEDRVKEQVKSLETALFANRAVTIEDYRHMTGQLRGLTVALNIMKDLQIKVENDDWED